MTASSRRAAALAAAALAASLAACGRGGGGAPPPSGPPPPVVGVVTVEPRRVSADAELTGQLEAAETVRVHAEMAGIVESIEFEEGARVAKGQVLFRLRDDEPLARLHEAEADLRLASDRYRRARDLHTREIVPEAALQDASATLAAVRARLEVARVSVDRTQIRAPFDGMAGARLVSPGARIEPDQDLVKVESIATLQLIFTLPEDVLPLARTGVPLELSVSPYPGERFPAEVSFVAPSLDAQSRRLLVKARVPNPELKLRPGLFANVHASIGDRENALLVPDDAIVYGREGSTVWRLDAQGAAQLVSVQLAARQRGLVEVTSGLAAGDVIVVSGTNKLAPGMRVEAVPASEGASPEASRSAAAPSAGPGPGAGGPPAESVAAERETKR